MPDFHLVGSVKKIGWLAPVRAVLSVLGVACLLIGWSWAAQRLSKLWAGTVRVDVRADPFVVGEGLSTHPVDVLKLIAPSISAEQEAYMRSVCDAPAKQ